MRKDTGKHAEEKSRETADNVRRRISEAVERLGAAAQLRPTKQRSGRR